MSDSFVDRIGKKSEPTKETRMFYVFWEKDRRWIFVLIRKDLSKDLRLYIRKNKELPKYALEVRRGLGSPPEELIEEMRRDYNFLEEDTIKVSSAT